MALSMFRERTMDPRLAAPKTSCPGPVVHVAQTVAGTPAAEPGLQREEPAEPLRSPPSEMSLVPTCRTTVPNPSRLWIDEGVGSELRAAKQLQEVKTSWGGGEGLEGPLQHWHSQGSGGAGAGMRTASPGVRRDEAGATTEEETSRAASSCNFCRRSSSCFFSRMVICRSSSEL
ncbi:hypothetical protein SRHO_G00018410 [Serrasalmus rhombeus]